MPQSKKVHKEYMRKRREGSQDEGSQDKGSQEMVPASYVQGITGKFLSLPERPRYLTLSDGQVLDRLNQPEGHASGDFILRMRYCNETYNYHPNKGRKNATK